MFGFLIVARCSIFPNLQCRILGAVFAPKLELGLCHCDKIFNNNNQKKKNPEKYILKKFLLMHRSGVQLIMVGSRVQELSSVHIVCTVKKPR